MTRLSLGSVATQKVLAQKINYWFISYEHVVNKVCNSLVLLQFLS